MPGPAPHARTDVEWVDLPADGRTEGIPNPPDSLGSAGEDWWRRSWCSPAAVMWDANAGEFDTAKRRAELEDVWQREREPKVLTEMRQCDLLLGLTAKARKELRWRIVSDDGDVVEQATREDEVAQRREERRKRHAV